MGLHEPSPVTPSSCSLLFPNLGRAGMGDKLMVVFENLPRERKRLRDVCVYNAPIPGLSFCGRRSCSSQNKLMIWKRRPLLKFCIFGANLEVVELLNLFKDLPAGLIYQNSSVGVNCWQRTKALWSGVAALCCIISSCCCCNARESCPPEVAF